MRLKEECRGSDRLQDNGQCYGDGDDDIYGDLKGKHDPAFLFQFFHHSRFTCLQMYDDGGATAGYEIVTIGVAFVICLVRTG